MLLYFSPITSGLPSRCNHNSYFVVEDHTKLHRLSHYVTSCQKRPQILLKFHSMTVILSKTQQPSVVITPEDNPQGNKISGTETKGRILIQLVFNDIYILITNSYTNVKTQHSVTKPNRHKQHKHKMVIECCVLSFVYELLSIYIYISFYIRTYTVWTMLNSSCC
jgi:hypothetical protein